MITQLIFFYFAGVILISAICVISLRNLVYSALSLLVTLVHVAGIFLLLNAELIAAIQIIIYAGAILIFYLFVMMMFDVKREERFFHRQTLVALFLGAVILGEMAVMVRRAVFAEGTGEFTVQRVVEMGNAQAVGTQLFTRYLIPFEVASLILLVAMVGAIVLAKRV